MKIAGLEKLTLLDFPGKMAAIVFCAGCNFCCPFCHNKDLVISQGTAYEITQDEIFAFLDKRKNILDGVVISGGEPLINDDITDFIKKIKDKGFDIKLDTNGAFPEKLKAIIDSGIVDYVAMDIKNSKEKYAMTIGRKEFDILPIEESVEFLMQGKVPFEFRTTVTGNLHEKEDFYEIGKWIKGTKNYFLQPYRHSENVIKEGITVPEKSDLEGFLSVILPFVPGAEIRGI